MHVNHYNNSVNDWGSDKPLSRLEIFRTMPRAKLLSHIELALQEYQFERSDHNRERLESIVIALDLKDGVPDVMRDENGCIVMQKRKNDGGLSAYTFLQNYIKGA